jgi:hypothetical protein
VELGDKIDWTVFRVPLLKGKELGSGGEVNAVWVGDKHGKDGLNLDRGRLAMWILKEIEDRNWVALCPILSNA